jgi:hypothetical protein
VLFDFLGDFCSEYKRLSEFDECGRTGYAQILVVWVVFKAGFGL